MPVQYLICLECQILLRTWKPHFIIGYEFDIDREKLKTNGKDLEKFIIVAVENSMKELARYLEIQTEIL